MTLLRRYKKLLLVMIVLAFASACDGAVAASLRAGAGRAAIEIGQADLPVDGYVSVHDNGSQRIVLVTVDLTSMPETSAFRHDTSGYDRRQGYAADRGKETEGAGTIFRRPL